MKKSKRSREGEKRRKLLWIKANSLPFPFFVSISRLPPTPCCLVSLSSYNPFPSFPSCLGAMSSQRTGNSKCLFHVAALFLSPLFPFASSSSSDANRKSEERKSDSERGRGGGGYQTKRRVTTDAAELAAIIKEEEEERGKGESLS